MSLVRGRGGGAAGGMGVVPSRCESAPRGGWARLGGWRCLLLRSWPQPDILVTVGGKQQKPI